jgi:hypothetical protein
MHRTGLRQRKTGGEAEPLRRRIDRDEQVEIAALAEDDKWRNDLRRLPLIK